MTYSNQLYSDTYTSKVWTSGFLVDGNDGYIYGDFLGKFFKVNITTKVFTEIKDEKVKGLIDGGDYLFNCDVIFFYSYS